MEYVPTPDEAAELLVMFRAFDALRKLGWREAIYAPCDGVVGEIAAHIGDAVESKDLLLKLRES